MSLVIGVEVSPAAIRAVVLERAACSAWLKATATDPATPLRVAAAVEVLCETTNAEALTSALRQLRHTLRTPAPVILGLPTTSTILTALHPLIPEPRRATLAVQFELQQQLPFDVGDADWHYQWLNGDRKFGIRNSEFGRATAHSAIRIPNLVVAAAARRRVVDECLACCQRAGLLVRAVSLSALANLNTWKVLHASSRSGVLLHVLSPQAAEWVIWSQTGLQAVPVLSASPQTFAQDLAGSWEVLPIERDAGSIPIHVVGPSRLSMPAQEVLRRNGAAAPETFEVPMVHQGAAGQGDALTPVVTALGLALQGMGAAALSLNLIASRQEETRLQRTHQLAWWVSGLSAVAITGLLGSGMVELRRQRVTVLEALQQRQSRYQALRPEIRELLLQQQQLQQRMQQLEQLVGESSAVTHLLARVSDALPETVWLTRIDCARGSPIPGSARGVAAPPGAGQVIEGLLEGRARSFQDATQLLERLKTIPGMLAVRSISATPATDPATGKEFVAFAVQLQQALQP